jgi:hypothetical protein
MAYRIDRSAIGNAWELIAAGAPLRENARRVACMVCGLQFRRRAAVTPVGDDDELRLSISCDLCSKSLNADFYVATEIVQGRAFLIENPSQVLVPLADDMQRRLQHEHGRRTIENALVEADRCEELGLGIAAGAIKAALCNASFADLGIDMPDWARMRFERHVGDYRGHVYREMLGHGGRR